MKAAFAILLFLLLHGSGLAQPTKKIPVQVRHLETDQVGRSFAFSLKEAIRSSQAFFLDNEQAFKKPRIVVVLTSMDTSRDRGLSSAIGYTIIFERLDPIAEQWLMSKILLCELNAVDICAKTLLPDIDKGANFLQKVFPGLWRAQ